MKTRIGIAVGLALVLSILMIAAGTIPVAPNASGPYVAATANYAVATATAAGSCPNTQCRYPGTTDLRCKHVVGSWCTVNLSTNECADKLCLAK